jgi:hypothetical protein
LKLVRAWSQTTSPHAEDKLKELISIVADTLYLRRVYDLNEAMEEWIAPLGPEVVEMMLTEAMDRRYRTNVRPTGQTFWIAMKAWIRSESVEAPHRVELLFQSMLQTYQETKDTLYRPREPHIRGLMTAWLSKCRHGHRFTGLAGLKYPAEHVEAFLQLHRESDWMRKTLIGHYAMALRLWAVQNIDANGPDEPNPIERLGFLLHQLREIKGSDRLPAFPCNWVLEGCCREYGTVERRLQAYHLAVETFGVSTRNARSFTLMVQVIKRQVRDLDETHLQSIDDLFQECCSAGMLTQDMIWEIIEVASAESLRRLFGISHQYAEGIVKVRQGQLDKTGSELEEWRGNLPHALHCKNLPRSWHCNASKDLPEE